MGGGITGLTAAYLLKQSGKRVCVLEKNRIGAGQTSRTSAHVTFVTDLHLTELAHKFGADNAKLVWQGHDAAINLIEQITHDANIDCGFQRVSNFLYSADGSKDDIAMLRDEQECNLQQGL